jgi:cysteine desulfurase
MSYFDNNATTPMTPAALEVLCAALEQDWTNPSSPYLSSARVRASIEKCRESIASSLSVSADQLTFTSGATESNNSVFFNVARMSSSMSRVLISLNEHPSVSEAASHWFPGRVDFLTNTPEGSIDIEQLPEYFNAYGKPALVSVMAASNESGVIQPWQQVAKFCRSHGVLYHCDSTQLPGKENLHDLNTCSFNVSSAHKFGGPKGIGWLVGSDPSSLLLGGNQEKGRRGGTENFPAIISAVTAWQSHLDHPVDSSQLSILRDEFEEQMAREFPTIQFIGQKSPRLWNTSLFIMPQFENLRWVGKLDKLGFQVSTGSACSTTKAGGAPIAKAMNLSAIESKRLIRVSSFHSHERADWEALLSAFVQVHRELQKESADSSVISI